MSLLGKAWGATKWVGRNLTPLGGNGRLLMTVGLGVGAALTGLAPAAAFASAAQSITATSGLASYAMAGSELAWAGGGVAWDILANVGGELPEITSQAIESTQQAMAASL